MALHSTLSCSSHLPSNCFDLDMFEEESCTYECYRDTRGWAMRRGHCRRLRADKGKESERGRSSFARSVNSRPRRDSLWWMEERARSERKAFRSLRAEVSNRSFVRDEAAFASALWVDQASEWDCWSEDERDCADAVENVDGELGNIEIWCSEGPFGSEIGSEISSSSPCAVSSANSSVSTTNSHEDSPSNSLPVSFRGGDKMEPAETPVKSSFLRRLLLTLPQLCPKRSPPPVEGVATDVRGLPSDEEEDHVGEAAATATPAPSPVGCQQQLLQPQRRGARWLEAQVVAKQGLDAWLQARGLALKEEAERKRRTRHVPPPKPVYPEGSYEKFREDFLQMHGTTLMNELTATFQGPVKLVPAPMEKEVTDRFMQAKKKANRVPVVPVYHGTMAKHHQSIFNRGLLIPGVAPGVLVRNGLSHGTGVYTSRMGAAWLSRQFCTEPRMLVCALLDDAVPINHTKILGRFQVKKESDHVRHIGDALVVFDTDWLIPLFEAQGTVPFNAPTVPAATLGSSNPNSAFKPLRDPQALLDKFPAKKPKAKGGLLRRKVQPKGEDAIIAYLTRRGAEKRRL